jgi:peptidoglycan hydrolase CwlO-like protein
MRIFDFNFIRKRRSILFLAVLFTVCALAMDIEAQGSAQERANALRAQLGEVLTKQQGLQARLQSLEEELKPENIEKSLSGIGSTHPEDLRELRRRQLELEKTSIQTQLNQLAESKTRLEARILQADADAYHQSAGINPGKPKT